jgi:hypothetical protein
MFELFVLIEFELLTMLLALFEIELVLLEMLVVRSR